MKPILSRRSRVRPASSSVPTSWPPTNACPDVGRSSPAMQCISVDFPEPDGPITAVNRPRSKVTSMPARACTTASPVPYVLRKPTARAAGAVCVLLATCSVLSAISFLRLRGKVLFRPYVLAYQSDIILIDQSLVPARSRGTRGNGAAAAIGGGQAATGRHRRGPRGGGRPAAGSRQRAGMGGTGGRELRGRADPVGLEMPGQQAGDLVHVIGQEE